MIASDYLLDLKNALSTLYDNREAENIARYVMEELYGRNFIKQNSLISELQINELNTIRKRLLESEPVQYALGSAWFYNLKFIVTPDVLIPRPETEEMVEKILLNIHGKNASILDIGTGSGCIAITIKKNAPQCNLFASDISESALAIAKKNAELHSAEIEFIQNDITKIPCTLPGPFDIIVSNPPYIPENEKKDMHRNVLQFEPHTALFTPTKNAVYFYEIIAEQALKLLKPGGNLFFEINYNYSEQIEKMLIVKGYLQNETMVDMQGKPRFVKCVRS